MNPTKSKEEDEMRMLIMNETNFQNAQTNISNKQELPNRQNF